MASWLNGMYYQEMGPRWKEYVTRSILLREHSFPEPCAQSHSSLSPSLPPLSPPPQPFLPLQLWSITSFCHWCFSTTGTHTAVGHWTESQQTFLLHVYFLGYFVKTLINKLSMWLTLAFSPWADCTDTMCVQVPKRVQGRNCQYDHSVYG